VILGAGVMQGPALRIAREMGLETVAVDGDPRAVNRSLADRFERIDLKDREGIEGLCRSLQARGSLGGIMTAGTDFSATVAWVAERLGLPGIPYEAALNASDKERMRGCFKRAGLSSPDYTVLGEVPGEDFSPPFPYPAVVKPVDNMGSRGCRRVDSGPELRAAVAEALGFSRSRRAILEEYMEGPEFSVDAIIHGEEIVITGLADRHIFFPPYFIEMGHTMPSTLPAPDAGRLLDLFKAGIRALGIAGPGAAGAAKGDLKFGPRGPMIGEIAARLSGGYMSGWTYPYASGLEPTRGAILAALGRDPGDLAPVRSWVSAERAFISIPGRVRSVLNAGSAGETPLVRDLFFRVNPGDPVRFPENNVSKCGNVISAAPDRDAAVAAAEGAARSILIRLEAPDAETEAFLGEESPFPPASFALSGELRALLEELPDPPLAPGSLAPGNLVPGKAPPDLAILDFPALLQGNLRDYAGRTVAETLDAVRALTGLPLPLTEDPGTGPSGGDSPVLGRRFWTALVRGGYQGGVYAVDLLFNPPRE
jgi:biotin carboxylase